MRAQAAAFALLWAIANLASAGEQATLEKGAACLEQYLLDDLGLDRDELEVVEGSGISFDNHLTPIALTRIVRAFYPHRRLLPSQDGILLKTGTLEGVYTLAGYLPAERPVFFAIMLNQRRNTRDQILSLLVRQAWSGDPGVEEEAKDLRTAAKSTW